MRIVKRKLVVTVTLSVGYRWKNKTLFLSKCGKCVKSKAIPVQSLRVPGGLDSQISRQSAHEGGKVVSPTHQPLLPPRKYSWFSLLLETESVSES